MSNQINGTAKKEKNKWVGMVSGTVSVCIVGLYFFNPISEQLEKDCKK